MEFFRIKKSIPFMDYSLIFNAISIITFLISIFFIGFKGLNLSIEFTGGAIIELHYQETASLDSVRRDISKIIGHQKDFQVQSFGSDQDILIRLPYQKKNKEKEISLSQQIKLIIQVLHVSSPNLQLKRVEFVGPQVGKELLIESFFAFLFVVLGIILYLSMRFEWKYAIAGIIANLHDIVIILGFFSAFNWEFSLSVLAAILAILGYSINESVIIFDRIRETFRIKQKKNNIEVVNLAITETIGRTIITHGSTQMMVLSILLFGGPTLHYFGLALNIGILCSIYSSVFVAASLALSMNIQKNKKINNKIKKTYDPNFGAQI